MLTRFVLLKSAGIGENRSKKNQHENNELLLDER